MAQSSARSQGATLVGVSDQPAFDILKSFDEESLKVLDDKPRPGSPRESTEQERGKPIALNPKQARGSAQ